MLLFKILKRLVAVLVIMAVILPIYAGVRVWSAAQSANPVKSDVIVVLGAAQFDGRPSDVLLARLKTAKSMFSQNLATRIFTVGYRASGDRTTEAATGRAWLISEGLPKDRVRSIPVGIDTLSSTVGYVAIMKLQKLKTAIIVTDEYHCLRATTMARDLGIVASCSPTSSGPASTSTSGFKYLFRETFAYLAYVTVGRHGIHLTDQTNK